MQKHDVAPCHECGNLNSEIEHFNQRRHTYFLCEPFEGLNVILCDFCWVDFGAIHPEYFGLPRTQISHRLPHKLRQLDGLKIERDWVCEHCKARQQWLQFVVDCRNKFSGDEAAK
ncbi:MAG: hypothetical protein R3C55_12645 [Parvularculaceae bacterium]